MISHTGTSRLGPEGPRDYAKRLVASANKARQTRQFPYLLWRKYFGKRNKKHTAKIHLTFRCKGG